MIIPIRAPENIDGQPTEKVEWVMLELNGELLKPLDEERKKVSIALDANDIRRRVELGAVKFDGDGAPTLIIGNHELKGSSIKLKEPFAVLRKRKSNQITNDINENNGDGGTVETTLNKHSGVQLEVVGCVKKKLMFDSYPKSIMR